MITYRSFRNSDPPHLLRLWHACQLGRGAAQGFPCEVLDMLVFAEPYFDRQGLIVACDGKQPVGFIHAGFGTNATEERLDRSLGVICAVLVLPDYRRQGIGRELVRRAEEFLARSGAVSLQAGEAEPRNPFYMGLYGGSESVGFLESDPLAGPFFLNLGYQPAEKYFLYRRDITQRNEPFDPRLIPLRRKMQLQLSDAPLQPSWWWNTRQGRFDTLHFALVPNSGGDSPVGISCWGMDFHSSTRRQRTVGMLDLRVVDSERRKGYGKAIVIEVIRRLREELVTHLEIAVREDNEPARKLFSGLGFQSADTGIVYRKLVAGTAQPAGSAAESAPATPAEQSSPSATFRMS